MNTRKTMTGILQGAKRLLTLMVAAALLATMLPATAAAMDPNQVDVFRNNVQLFNFDDRLPGQCATTGLVENTNRPDMSLDSDNIRIAFEFFTKTKGLAPFRAAGIVGNLHVEAPGLNPKTNQNGDGAGRGIAQWSVNQRWVDLQRWANGRDIYDINTQLDFLWHEMTNVRPWNQSLPAVQAETTMNRRLVGNPPMVVENTGATWAFMITFEKPGIPHLDRREAAAIAILKKYAPGQPDNGAPVNTPTQGGGPSSPGDSQPCSAGIEGNFTGAPGQTKPQGKGFTLADNTDYSATACFTPGSSEVMIYRHPVANFRVRLCKIGQTNIIVASIVSERVVKMLDEARKNGVNMTGGAFRKYEDQLAIYNGRGCPCNPPVAKPGSSQHERGLAIDFNPGMQMSKSHPTHVWMATNGPRFGFFNLASEPWHWSTSGH